MDTGMRASSRPRANARVRHGSLDGFSDSEETGNTISDPENVFDGRGVYACQGDINGTDFRVFYVGDYVKGDIDRSND
jgi:hypothetical protein